MTLPAGPFGVILADPPWAFRTYSGNNATPHRSAEDHYTTMTAEDLRALPVASVAAPNAALFMWIVDSHLPEALQLGEAWGFQSKSVAFIWLKREPLDERQEAMLQPIPRPAKMGMGYTTRKQVELCLLFTRGKPRRLSKGVRQVIEAPRREHSRKPDETFTRVEALYAGPYLEMFARQQRPGWTVWGNQTEKFGRVA